ncbi:MAG: tetratricopeptide repeat protein, partial [Planctomycetota bacterium]
MKFQSSPKYQTLTSHLEKKSVLLVCGPEINEDSTFQFSVYKKMRDQLLSHLAEQNSQLLSEYLPSLTHLDILSTSAKKNLSFERTLAEIVSHQNDFLTCFQSLEQEKPNEIHLYIAKLAKAGYFPYIISTNFDVYLEHAFKIEGVRYQTHRSFEEFSLLDKETLEDPEQVHLLKIRGCLRLPKTITADLLKEDPRLIYIKQKILTKLFNREEVLFLGYNENSLRDVLTSFSLEPQPKTSNFWIIFPEEPDKSSQSLSILFERDQEKIQFIYESLSLFFKNILDTASHFPQLPLELLKKKELEKKDQTVHLTQTIEEWFVRKMSPMQAEEIFLMLLWEVDSHQTLSYLNRLIQHLQAQSHSGELAKIWNYLGKFYKEKKDYPSALEALQQAETITKTLQDKQGLAKIFYQIGTIYRSQKNYSLTIRYFEEAVKIARSRDDQKALGYYLNNLGILYHKQKNIDQALEIFQQVEHIGKTIGDHKTLANCLNNLGMIFQEKKDLERALWYSQKTLEIDRILGEPDKLIEDLMQLGHLYKTFQRYDKALHSYQEAYSIARDIQNSTEIASTLNAIGNIYKAQASYKEAENYFSQAVQLVRSLPKSRSLAVYLNNLGICHFRKGESLKALDCFQEAENQAHIFRDKKSLANAVINLGMLYQELKEYSKALLYYRQTVELDQVLGDKKKVAITYNN